LADNGDARPRCLDIGFRGLDAGGESSGFGGDPVGIVADARVRTVRAQT
jgi:hypothetical protein